MAVLVPTMTVNSVSTVYIYVNTCPRPIKQMQ